MSLFVRFGIVQKNYADRATQPIAGHPRNAQRTRPTAIRVGSATAEFASTDMSILVPEPFSAIVRAMNWALVRFSMEPPPMPNGLAFGVMKTPRTWKVPPPVML